MKSLWKCSFKPIKAYTPFKSQLKFIFTHTHKSQINMHSFYKHQKCTSLNIISDKSQEELNQAMILLDNSLSKLRGEISPKSYCFQNIIESLNFLEVSTFDKLNVEADELFAEYFKESIKSDNLYSSLNKFEKVSIFHYLRFIRQNKLRSEDIVKYIDTEISCSLDIFNSDNLEERTLQTFIDFILGLIYNKQVYQVQYPLITLKFNEILGTKFNSLDEDSKAFLALNTIYCESEKPIINILNHLQMIAYLKSTIQKRNNDNKYMIAFQIFPKIINNFARTLQNNERAKIINDGLAFFKPAFIEAINTNFNDSILISFSNCINYLGVDYDLVRISMNKIIWNLASIEQQLYLEFFFLFLRLDLTKVWDISEYKKNLEMLISVILKQKRQDSFNYEKTLTGELFRSQNKDIKDSFTILSTKRKGIIHPIFKRLLEHAINFCPYSGVNYVTEMDIAYKNFEQLKLGEQNN